MPVLKRYQDRPGSYIRARAADSVITFQVSPSARSALEDADYATEGSVPWTVIKPLYEEGAVYTRNSGDTPDVASLAQDGSKHDREEILRHFSGSDASIDRSAVQELVKDDPLPYGEAIPEVVDSVIEPSSLRDLSNVPAALVDLESNSGGLTHVYETGSGLRVRLRDLRWSPSSEETHFRLRVSDVTGDGITDLSDDGAIECEIYDGWLTSWTDDENTIQHQPGDDYGETHNRIFRTVGARSSLGYTPREEPYELVQRLFLFVDHYDIKPNSRGDGHKRFASLSEIEGKHVWIQPKSTISSSGDSDIYQISCELRNFRYHTDRPFTYRLVEFPNEVDELAMDVEYRAPSPDTLPDLTMG